jgi:hypothetical protein
MYRSVHINNTNLKTLNKTTENFDSMAGHESVFTQRVYKDVLTFKFPGTLLLLHEAITFTLFHKSVLHAAYNTFTAHNNSNYSSKFLIQTPSRTVPVLVFYLEFLAL